jgi:hypothetical protein
MLQFALPHPEVVALVWCGFPPGTTTLEVYLTHVGWSEWQEAINAGLVTGEFVPDAIGQRATLTLTRRGRRAVEDFHPDALSIA